MIFIDDVGRRITFTHPPARIVSLAPSTTENLFAIGAGKMVVGVTTADDYPPQVAHLPRTGSFYQPLAERIRALRPDLVIVDSATIHRSDMDNLQLRLQTPLYAQSSRRFADVNRQLLRLGEITGHEREAQLVTTIVSAKAEQVARYISNKKPVPVFVQIDTSALYAAGPGSFLDDVIRLAGGLNIVRGSNPFPLVSKEMLLSGDPAVYIFTIPRVPGGPPPTPPPVDPALRDLVAVKTHRVYALDSNLLTRPTARLADGLLALTRVLFL